MIYEASFRADGYTATFKFLSVDRSEMTVEMITELKIDPAIAELSLASSPEFYNPRHLILLLKYLETHLERLEQGINDETHSFLLLEKRFTLCAGAGEIDNDGTGGFAIQFAVNLGGPTPKIPDVYV